MLPVKKTKKIGQFLLDAGIIGPDALERALEKQPGTGKLIGELLIREGSITFDDLARALAGQYGLPFFDLSSYRVPEQSVKNCPAGLLKKVSFFPLKIISEKALVIIPDPGDTSVVSEISRGFSGRSVEFFVGNSRKIEALRCEALGLPVVNPPKEIRKEVVSAVPVLPLSTPGNPDPLWKGSGTDPGELSLEEIMPSDLSFTVSSSENGESRNSFLGTAVSGRLDAFTAGFADQNRHYLVCLISGERFVGSIADRSPDFLLLNTATGAKMVNLAHIAYIEEKNIKGGGEL